MPSIVRRYDIQKGNKPKFSRWLASKQGKEAVDSETRWSCHTPEEIDVLIQRFVKKFYTKQEPLSFKLTCQFDDFRRMSENKDFGSCFADTGSQSQAKYSLMSDPTVCMLYTADKSGKIVWRTLAHLGKDIKGFCLILVRPYGDESTPVLDIVEALKQKIRVAATTHVDFIIPIRATDFQLCYPERVVGDTFPYYTDLLTHFSDTSVYEKPLSSKARGI